VMSHHSQADIENDKGEEHQTGLTDKPSLM
jgi:hypothetical protein